MIQLVRLLIDAYVVQTYLMGELRHDFCVSEKLSQNVATTVVGIINRHLKETPPPVKPKIELPDEVIEPLILEPLPMDPEPAAAAS